MMAAAALAGSTLSAETGRRGAGAQAHVSELSRADGRAPSPRGELACVFQSIACGETFASNLGLLDCPAPGGNHTDAWLFSGVVGDVVTLSADSADFDTHLDLLHFQTSQILASDDGSGGGTNARIADFVLPATAPNWELQVSSTFAGLGSYSLSLACQAASTPTAPSDPSANAISATEIELLWQDNSLNEEEFRVEIMPPGEAFQDIGSVSANAIGARISDVLPETTYLFRVRARNSAGDSAYTSTAQATTPAEPPPTSTDPCLRDAHTACLLDPPVDRGAGGPGDGRFEVTVQMHDFANPPNGPGSLFQGMVQTYNGESSETTQAVNFYAFEEGNVEVFVKMVDACTSGFNSFWVFVAGATNAETVILIRDTWTGEVYRIDNPRGVDFFVAPDTQAFKTCDASPP